MTGVPNCRCSQNRNLPLPLICTAEAHCACDISAFAIHRTNIERRERECRCRCCRSSKSSPTPPSTMLRARRPAATKRKARSGGIGSTTGAGICHAYTPDGRCVSLLKILLTNFCIYDCAYCVSRRSSNVAARPLHGRGGRRPDARPLPAQLHRGTVPVVRHRARARTTPWPTWCGWRSTLRLEHGFKGYIHLKTIPGAGQS